MMTDKGGAVNHCLLVGAYTPWPNPEGDALETWRNVIYVSDGTMWELPCGESRVQDKSPWQFLNI